MKRLLSIVGSILFVALTLQVMGQVNPSDPNYEQMKMSGQIAQPSQVAPPSEPVKVIAPDPNPNRAAGLLIPRDQSFTLAMGPNDDLSTGLIQLPFTFCLFDLQYTSCYINNNGNISFGAPYFDYVPTGFPVNAYPMVAAFWADVDTRTGTGCPYNGSVWYKIQTNPNRLIVIWEEVGYFSIHCNLINTFELIITDGEDPLVGINKNVAFSFADMQWTTGDINGAGGFGASAPATVGINKGDGVYYALVGRFGHAGTDYDLPLDLDAGVSWLDEKDFKFDACVGDIVVTPVANWALYLGIGLILIIAAIRFRKLF
jgi:hypothetical protein